MLYSGIFSDPYGVEDLVLVYLQAVQGYVVIPSSRESGKPATEFTLISRRKDRHGQVARVQVKTGQQPVDLSELADALEADEHGFADSTAGEYARKDHPRITKLADAELLKFVRSNPKLLPTWVRKCLVRHGKTSRRVREMSRSNGPTQAARSRGSLLGLAIGDALGTTIEFSVPGRFEPVTDIVGGGSFALDPGQWTDDTSMALCLAESIIETGWDPVDQLERYLRWMRDGHLSSTGRCFGIGQTVLRALGQFQKTREPWSG